MAEVSERIFLGDFEVFGFQNERWIGVNPYEAAGAPPAPSFQIRTDTYASSVQIAVPGTDFGSAFGQTYYYSDISAEVRGTGANVPLTASGSAAEFWPSASVVNSGSYDFATGGGYDTSMFAEDGGSIGAVYGQHSQTLHLRIGL